VIKSPVKVGLIIKSVSVIRRLFVLCITYRWVACVRPLVNVVQPAKPRTHGFYNGASHVLYTGGVIQVSAQEKDTTCIGQQCCGRLSVKLQ
jgi:hypothetical protein